MTVGVWDRRYHYFMTPLLMGFLEILCDDRKT